MENKLDEILIKLKKLDEIQADRKQIKEVSNNNTVKISELTRKIESQNSIINKLAQQ